MHTASRFRQTGVVLFISLIALVAMSLAAIALVRSIDTGTIVAGNLSFKQSAVLSSDYGIEVARNWLMANKPSLSGDVPAEGYYASRQATLDITGTATSALTDDVNWDGTNGSALVTPKSVLFGSNTKDSSGNTVSFVINRLCEIVGSINAPSQSCATSTTTDSGSTKDAPRYDQYGLTEKQTIYYRVTVRVAGPRNTQTFIQTLLLF